jgi:hypothetical protein
VPIEEEEEVYIQEEEVYIQEKETNTRICSTESS